MVGFPAMITQKAAMDVCGETATEVVDQGVERLIPPVCLQNLQNLQNSVLKRQVEMHL
jgi:hypothetical protein